jgi:hypothetical protein
VPSVLFVPMGTHRLACDDPRLWPPVEDCLDWSIGNLDKVSDILQYTSNMNESTSAKGPIWDMKKLIDIADYAAIESVVVGAVQKCCSLPL